MFVCLSHIEVCKSDAFSRTGNYYEYHAIRQQPVCGRIEFVPTVLSAMASMRTTEMGSILAPFNERLWQIWALTGILYNTSCTRHALQCQSKTPLPLDIAWSSLNVSCNFADLWTSQCQGNVIIAVPGMRCNVTRKARPAHPSDDRLRGVVVVIRTGGKDSCAAYCTQNVCRTASRAA
jgi:hypothetical protein